MEMPEQITDDLMERVRWHINDIRCKAPEQLIFGCPLQELANRMINLPELKAYHVKQHSASNED